MEDLVLTWIRPCVFESNDGRSTLRLYCDEDSGLQIDDEGWKGTSLDGGKTIWVNIVNDSYDEWHVITFNKEGTQAYMSWEPQTLN